MALRPARSVPERRPDYVMPSDKDELVGWLDKRRIAAEGRMNSVQMRINLAYTLGHQAIVWDPVSRRLRRAEIDPQDPNPPAYVKVNKIGGIVERTISKLTRSAPIPECRPVSNEDNDVSAAKVGSRILDSEMNRMEWEDMVTRLYFWVVPVGWGYLHVCWDPEQGSVAGELEGVQLNIGQIKMEVVPPFELLVDPNARTFEEARWCVRSQVMTREAVYETYGKNPAGAEKGRTLADEVLSLGSGGALLARGEGGGDFVSVHQFWMIPGGRNRPGGMVATWAGNEFLEPVRDYPYEHGRLPFVQFDLLPGQGSYQGRTWVTDLIDMQKDYNDARSREATLRRIMIPHLVGPAGSINPKQMTSKIDYIPYNPVGQPPSWMIPDNRWAYQHEQAMTRADQEMGDRAGQAEVSQGRAPAGAPAAAILALQEADDTKLAVSAKMLAKGVRQCGHQVLSLVRQFWSEDRTVRTWSEEGKLEVRRFTGADVGQQLDVHVSSESALPRSKSAKAQLVMDLVDRQMLTDPRVIMRLLQIPGTDFLQAQLDRDTQQAERENDRLMTDPVDMPVEEMPKPAPWHNHAVHIAAHDDFRKTVDYEKSEPEVRARIDAHVDVHYQLVRQQQGTAGGAGGFDPAVAEQQAAEQAAAAEQDFSGGGGGPEYLDPMTGMPSDPLARASGQAPSARDLAAAAGIGGVGQPGQVPGVDLDAQAASMGS